MRAAALVAAATLAACDAVPAGDGPRRIVIRELGELVIIPTYDALAERGEAERVAIEALVAAPDLARLDAAQQAWRDARSPWMESQAFRFGPVKDRLLDAAIDQSPINLDSIETAIAGTEPIDADLIDRMGANKKGFHALEYLIFDPVGGDDAVVAALGASPRRRDYLAEVAFDLEEHCDELRDAWAVDGDDYLARFADVGGDDATFATIKEAVDGLVNESVFLSELITDTKLGKPLGHDAAGEPQPELEESGPSDNSLDDIAANLRGLRRVWEGGLRSLVAARSPAAAARVDVELDAAAAAISAVPRPFAAALIDRAPEVEAAWQAVRELRLTLATDVVALLGATLSFNDNDGD